MIDTINRITPLSIFVILTSSNSIDRVLNFSFRSMVPWDTGLLRQNPDQ